MEQERQLGNRVTLCCLYWWLPFHSEGLAFEGGGKWSLERTLVLPGLLVREYLPGAFFLMFVFASFVSSLTAPTFWPLLLLLGRHRILR